MSDENARRRPAVQEDLQVRLERTEAALAAAEEALRSRDAFLRLAGHELRGPLSAIQLQADALGLMARGDADSDELARRAARVTRQVQRMAWMLDEVLDLARASSGRFSLNRAEADLVSVMRRSIERHGEVLTRAGCEVRLDAPGTLVGPWDENRLEHAFGALLTQAAQSGAGDPVEVEVKADPGAPARVVVRDGGQGLAEDDRAAVFDRFERALGAVRPGAPTLALWLARVVIEAHGGRLELVTGKPGEAAIATLPRP